MDTRKLAVSFIAVAAIVTGCSSSATPSPSVAPATQVPVVTPAPATPTPIDTTVPSVTVSSFDTTYTIMSQFKNLTAAGSGLVGVILPDTTSSARYVDFDAPYLTQAFASAGYNTSQFKIDNAQGNDATELAIAQADITLGAKVLVMDPLDGTVGNEIQSLAASNGVTLISYDRATFQGTSTYYVSFDNVQVGKLIGQGFVDCVKAWNVANPQVFELDGGEDTDPNAISFATGYNNAIWGQAKTPLAAGVTNNGMTLVGEQITPGWNNTTGGTIFAQQFTAHPSINATVEANDGLANAVVTYLKSKGIKPNKIPTTGQDATLQGMENILTGYQCGSVYKPIYLEAQAAVALATILRAGQTPPAAFVNSTTTDPKDATIVEPAVLLTPVWVNASNMETSVIKDGFVSASALCTAVGAAVCTAQGIK
ncbi:MAG: substrate-binding domain-containing protein [Candidatus Limnocylindrales bacterium]